MRIRAIALVLASCTACVSGGAGGRWATTTPAAAATRASTTPRSFTPPSDWRAAYYALVRELGRDTARRGFLGRIPAAPRFDELRFAVADSIPGSLAYGYSDATPLLGLAHVIDRTVVFQTAAVSRDSVRRSLVMHEFAHILTGHADHPRWAFARDCCAINSPDTTHLAGLGAQASR